DPVDPLTHVAVVDVVRFETNGDDHGLVSPGRCNPLALACPECRPGKADRNQAEHGGTSPRDSRVPRGPGPPFPPGMVCRTVPEGGHGAYATIVARRHRQARGLQRARPRPGWVRRGRATSWPPPLPVGNAGTRGAQRSETGPHLRREDLRLFPGSEVAT